MTDRRFLLLVNPSAGGGRARKLLPEVERLLRERGLAHRLVLTEGIDHGREEAVRAAEAGEIPVVMSGDGLIGQVGGALVGCELPLGVIPGGRGNDFARVIGIPRAMAGAVEVLAGGHTREIDVGEANGARFLCIASAGFDSEANQIANRARLVRGNLVYAYAALRALAGWKPARFTVKLDGEVHRFSGYAVAAANSRAYGGGMYVAPRAELDDGMFDVVMTGEVGKLRFLASLPKVFKGGHVDSDEVSVRRAARVEISADRPFAVYADGDQIAELPVSLRLLHRALKVLVPVPRPAE